MTALARFHTLGSQMKRIKHNDLTHYFLRPHHTLPRAYLSSCEKFFKAGREDAAMYKRQIKEHKQQAPSFKQQAPRKGHNYKLKRN